MLRIEDVSGWIIYQSPRAHVHLPGQRINKQNNSNLISKIQTVVYHTTITGVQNLTDICHAEDADASTEPYLSIYKFEIMKIYLTSQHVIQ